MILAGTDAGLIGLLSNRLQFHLFGFDCLFASHYVLNSKYMDILIKRSHLTEVLRSMHADISFIFFFGCKSVSICNILIHVDSRASLFSLRSP